MDSYQEVAYNISNSNRGYIFLISAAKFIFLAITAAFAINYCACYLTQLCLLSRNSSDEDPFSSAQIYGIYFVFVTLVGGLLFVPYHRLRDEQASSYNHMVIYAKVFAGAFSLYFVFVMMSILVAVCQSENNFPDSILY